MTPFKPKAVVSIFVYSTISLLEYGLWQTIGSVMRTLKITNPNSYCKNSSVTFCEIPNIYQFCLEATG
jgi:hypothetical protein